MNSPTFKSLQEKYLGQIPYLTELALQGADYASGVLEIHPAMMRRLLKSMLIPFPFEKKSLIPCAYMSNVHDVEELRNIYVEGGRSAVAKYLNISYNTVGHVLADTGIYYDSDVRRRRRSKVREDNSGVNPFEVWSDTSAYILGYILGDGSISRRGVYEHALGTPRMALYSKDYDNLLDIARCFGKGEQDLHKRTYTQGYKDGWFLYIFSESVMQFLETNGIRPRKSYVGGSISTIPDQFLWSAVRGLMDSDGYVRIMNNLLQVNLAGHPSYIKEIELRIPNIPWKYNIQKSDGLAILSVYQQVFMRDIYHNLYSSATIYLRRKQEVFNEYFRLRG